MWVLTFFIVACFLLAISMVLWVTVHFKWDCKKVLSEGGFHFFSREIESHAHLLWPHPLKLYKCTLNSDCFHKC